MSIGFWRVGYIEVNYVRHLFDIESTSGNIRSDKNVERSFPKNHAWRGLAGIETYFPEGRHYDGLLC